MSRVLLIVLSLLVIVISPLDTGATRRFYQQRWDASEPIIVENRAGPEWNEGVEFVVRSWHRQFPRLRYKVIHQPNKPCDFERGKIIICAVPHGGWTLERVEGRQIVGLTMRTSRLGPSKEAGRFNGHLSRFDVYALCRQFGRGLGLAPYDRDRNSCMGLPYTDGIMRPDVPITPSRYDRQSLKMLYKRSGPAWP